MATGALRSHEILPTSLQCKSKASKRVWPKWSSWICIVSSYSRIYWRGLRLWFKGKDPSWHSSPRRVPEVQAAFPAIRELDLRQMPPNASHGPYFAMLASLQRIYISSLQRSSDPHVLFREVCDFATAVQVDIKGSFQDINDASSKWKIRNFMPPLNLHDQYQHTSCGHRHALGGVCLPAIIYRITCWAKACCRFHYGCYRYIIH